MKKTQICEFSKECIEDLLRLITDGKENDFHLTIGSEVVKLHLDATNKHSLKVNIVDEYYPHNKENVKQLFDFIRKSINK
jgi:hypothetical protein